MADLSTTYMGVALKNPLIVAASSISNRIRSTSRPRSAQRCERQLRSAPWILRFLP